MGIQLPSPKGHSPHPIFGPYLLRPNGCMDQDATWYEGRPQPREFCVRWGPNPPPKFSAQVYYSYGDFVRTFLLISNPKPSKLDGFLDSFVSLITQNLYSSSQKLVLLTTKTETAVFAAETEPKSKLQNRPHPSHITHALRYAVL